MALEPIGSQKPSPQKASADVKNADVFFNSEQKAQKTQAGNAQEKQQTARPAEQEQTGQASRPGTDTVQPSACFTKSQRVQVFQTGTTAQNTESLGHMQRLHKGFRVPQAERNSSLHASDALHQKADIIAVSGFRESLERVIQACNLVPSPIAEKAVMLAMSEGLRLSPSLLRKIIKLLKSGASSDTLTLIKALDYDDPQIFEAALALLAVMIAQHHAKDSSRGQSFSQKYSSEKASVSNEYEEKQVIINQFKELMSNAFGSPRVSFHDTGGAGYEQAQSSGGNPVFHASTIWIHQPFSFIQGSLNLTGTLRMVYNYCTKKIDRMVLECTDSGGERIAVLEDGKALVWSSVPKECSSLEQQGFTCLSSKADIEACAWCGMTAVMSRRNEKQ